MPGYYWTLANKSKPTHIRSYGYEAMTRLKGLERFKCRIALYGYRIPKAYLIYFFALFVAKYNLQSEYVSIH